MQRVFAVKSLLRPAISKKISVEQNRIVITRLDGHEFVNSKPTPKEKNFWINYRVPLVMPTRWDMASPDPLAMAALDEWETKKLK
jgi:hypothetical protein